MAFRARKIGYIPTNYFVFFQNFCAMSVYMWIYTVMATNFGKNMIYMGIYHIFHTKKASAARNYFLFFILIPVLGFLHSVRSIENFELYKFVQQQLK